MATIAVFDSGLGSLSIVRAIQATTSCDIIYYADTASHPYGTKTPAQLRRIICHTIDGLRGLFRPDLLVVGSNTPTLLLDIEDEMVMGVWPPLERAGSITRNGIVAVLTTRNVADSGAVQRYASSLNVTAEIVTVDASRLIHQVESGLFLDNPADCRDVASQVLDHIRGADVCTLSSTHLPLIKHVMEEQRPDVLFLDPATDVARRVAHITGGRGDGTLAVYASDVSIQKNLRRLGINSDVNLLLFDNHD